MGPFGRLLMGLVLIPFAFLQFGFTADLYAHHLDTPQPQKNVCKDDRAEVVTRMLNAHKESQDIILHKIIDADREAVLKKVDFISEVNAIKKDTKNPLNEALKDIPTAALQNFETQIQDPKKYSTAISTFETFIENIKKSLPNIKNSSPKIQTIINEITVLEKRRYQMVRDREILVNTLNPLLNMNCITEKQKKKIRTARKYTKEETNKYLTYRPFSSKVPGEVILKKDEALPLVPIDDGMKEIPWSKAVKLPHPESP